MSAPSPTERPRSTTPTALGGLRPFMRPYKLQIGLAVLFLIGAAAATLLRAPRHPYTEALLSAVPIPDPKAKKQRIVLTGDVPNPVNRPTGCHFHPRCPKATERCKVEEPVLKNVGTLHQAACHLND